MNTAIFIVLCIIALSSIALTVLLVLILQEIREFVSHLRSLLDRMDKDVLALVANLNEASQNVSHMSESLNQRFIEADEILTKLKHVLSTFSVATQLLKVGVSSASIYTKSVMAGFKGAYDFISKRKYQGGRKNGM